MMYGSDYVDLTTPERSDYIDLRTQERINPNTNLHFHPSFERNDDLDDVIFVVANNVNGVIDLSTPETSTRVAQLNRRHSNVFKANRRGLLIDDSRSSLHRTAKDQNPKPLKATSMVEDKKRPEATILICPICMESPVQKEPSSTPCGHIFCKTCLEQSLNVNPKCPICRTKVNRKRLVRLYIENFLN